MSSSRSSSSSSLSSSSSSDDEGAAASRSSSSGSHSRSSSEAIVVTQESQLVVNETVAAASSGSVDVNVAPEVDTTVVSTAEAPSKATSPETPKKPTGAESKSPSSKSPAKSHSKSSSKSPSKGATSEGKSPSAGRSAAKGNHGSKSPEKGSSTKSGHSSKSPEKGSSTKSGHSSKSPEKSSPAKSGHVSKSPAKGSPAKSQPGAKSPEKGSSGSSKPNLPDGTAPSKEKLKHGSSTASPSKHGGHHSPKSGKTPTSTPEKGGAHSPKTHGHRAKPSERSKGHASSGTASPRQHRHRDDASGTDPVVVSLLPSERARMAGALFALASPKKSATRRKTAGGAGKAEKLIRASSEVTDRLRSIEGRVLPATLSQYERVLGDSKKTLSENPYLAACLSGNPDALDSASQDSAAVAEASSLEQFTPLHIAVVSGHAAVAASILKQFPAFATSLDFMHRTPLLIAVMNDDIPCVQALLTHLDPENSTGWDVFSLPDKQGCCPIHVAVLQVAYTPESSSKKKAASSSSSSDSDSNSDVEVTAQAIAKAKFPVLQLLVNATARRYSTDHMISVELSRPNEQAGGLTPLHFAVRSGKRELVEYLCEIDLRNRSNRGRKRSMVIPAEDMKNMNKAKLNKLGLIDVSAGDIAGDTPLHHAAAVGNELIVGLLVRMGGNVEQENNNGQTALHIASASLANDAAYVLVNNGADVAIRYRAAELFRETGTLDTGVSQLESAPSVDDYSRANRFGFVDKDANDEADAEAQQLAAARRRRELKNAMKWAPMFASEETFNAGRKKNPKKLREYVFTGLPDALRGRAWVTMLNADRPNKKDQKFYEEHKDAKTPDASQIDLDINRSQRSHLQFKERFGAGQAKLFRILTAYSLWDTKVGYCQGMSDMTAVLLMYMLEEEAFFALQTLLRGEKYAFGPRMEPGFPDLQMNFWVHEQLMIKHLPKLDAYFSGPPEYDDDGGVARKKLFKHRLKHPHMDSQLRPNMYCHRWYMMAFLDELPLETCYRVWDVLFLEGSQILYSVALTLLRLAEPHLLKMPFDEVMRFFCSGSEHELKQRISGDADAFMKEVLDQRIKPSTLKGLEAIYNRDHRQARADKSASMRALLDADKADSKSKGKSKGKAKA